MGRLRRLGYGTEELPLGGPIKRPERPEEEPLLAPGETIDGFVI